METYLLSTPDDANCISCKVVLSRDALAAIMTKKFMTTTFKEHREQQLFVRELALMPSTQPYVEQELQRRENAKILLKMTAERAAMKRKLDELDRACNDLRYNLTPQLNNEKRTFMHKCAANGCNGFLSTAWRCLVCTKYTCSECGALKNEGHVCIPDEKSSFELIKRDSRRCPGCAEYIFKISGCDQMFCTNCHTAFSWNTGRKINGHLHNPHYIEWQRNGGGIGRDVGDIPCGGRPGINEFAHVFAFLGRHHSQLNDALGILRLINHIEDVELQRYDANGITDNVKLRVQYSLNEIREEAFKVELQRQEKRNEKKRAIRLILDMLVNVTSDLLRQMVLARSLNPYLQNVQHVITYANGELIKVSRRYDCTIPYMLGYSTGEGSAHVITRRASDMGTNAGV